MSLLFFCLLLSAVIVAAGVAASRVGTPRIGIILGLHAPEARTPAAGSPDSDRPRILGRWPIRKLRR